MGSRTILYVHRLVWDGFKVLQYSQRWNSRCEMQTTFEKWWCTSSPPMYRELQGACAGTALDIEELPLAARKIELAALSVVVLLAGNCAWEY